MEETYKKIGIYKILNKKNGKFYIGRSKDIAIRISSHEKALERNAHFCEEMQEDFKQTNIKNMSHDNENEIICPYCDKQAVENSWEYNDYEQEKEIYCDNCNKDFIFTVEHKVTYSTRKKDCKGGKHDFGDGEINHDHTFDGFQYIERKCNNCGAKELMKEKIKSI